MEVHLTRRPGQTGTKKLVERYGKRLVWVRYRYDAQSGCRHKTVDLIVETVLWQPNTRRARRRDEEMIACASICGGRTARASQEVGRDLAAATAPVGNALARRNVSEFASSVKQLAASSKGEATLKGGYVNKDDSPRYTVNVRFRPHGSRGHILVAADLASDPPSNASVQDIAKVSASFVAELHRATLM